MLQAGSEIAPGRVIAGRYLVARRVGGGGMGVVYAARDTRLGRVVALKALGTSAKIGERDRLEAEARAVASLGHPGIVTLFDVLDDQGELILVMELVEGESLRARLERGRLDSSEVARIVSGIAEALAAAHARGLVHRDVKPDNVIVRPDGRTALLDFGVAKELSRDDGRALADTALPSGKTISLTAAGTVVGTPAYLAPEQAMAMTITPACDQFALAVTAFELLSGALPWPTANLAQLISAILGAAASSIGSTGAPPSPAADAVLSRALAKEPSSRYPDVLTFSRSLALALEEDRRSPLAVGSISNPDALARTVAAPPALQTPAARAPSPRWRRWRVATFAVASIAAIVVGGVARARWASLPPATQPGAATGSPGKRVLWTDLSGASSTSAAATADYLEAMKCSRIGKNDQLPRLLDSAIQLDPTFAAASLQRAIYGARLTTGLEPSSVTHFRAAFESRDRLDVTQRRYLEAMAPVYLDPPNWSDAERRLTAHVAEFPLDEPAWELVSDLRWQLGRLDAAEEAMMQASVVDPESVGALGGLAFIAAEKGDMEEAKRRATACLQARPEATLCQDLRGHVLNVLGECDELEKVGREMTSTLPESPWGFRFRAVSLLAQRAPPEATEALFVSVADHTGGGEPRARILAHWLAVSAFLRGDFDVALAKAEEAAKVPDTRFGPLSSAARLEAEILLEMGDGRRAGALSLELLKRAGALTLPDLPAQDNTGVLINYAKEGGSIGVTQAHADLEAWSTRWRKRLDQRAWKNQGRYVWVQMFGPLGEPTEASVDAMDRSSEFGDYPTTPPLHWAMNGWDVRLGAILLGAGRAEEAEQRLVRATALCGAEHPRALYLLGLAHERRANTAGACEAYASLLKRWGNARPRSVTADATKKRMSAIGCPTQP